MRFMLGFLFLISCGPQYGSGPEAQPQPGSAKAAVPSPAGGVAAQGSPGGEQGTAPRQTQNNASKKAEWQTMDYLTLGLLVVAGFQLVAFAVQLEFMRRTLDDTKASAGAAKISADAAKEAARIANATLIASKDAAERQLRAYLSVVPDSHDQWDETVSVEMVFSAKIKNCGSTPAYHLAAEAFARLLPVPFPDDTEISEIPSIGYLAPGGDLRLVTDNTLVLEPAKVMDLKTSQTERLYFFGSVVYEDAFRKRWRQRFCYYADWDVASDGLFLTVANTREWGAEVCIGGQDSRQDQPREGPR